MAAATSPRRWLRGDAVEIFGLKLQRGMNGRCGVVLRDGERSDSPARSRTPSPDQVRICVVSKVTKAPATLVYTKPIPVRVQDPATGAQQDVYINPANLRRMEATSTPQVVCTPVGAPPPPPPPTTPVPAAIPHPRSLNDADASAMLRGLPRQVSVDLKAPQSSGNGSDMSFSQTIPLQSPRAVRGSAGFGKGPPSGRPVPPRGSLTKRPPSGSSSGLLVPWPDLPREASPSPRRRYSAGFLDAAVERARSWGERDTSNRPLAPAPTVVSLDALQRVGAAPRQAAAVVQARRPREGGVLDLTPAQVFKPGLEATLCDTVTARCTARGGPGPVW